MSETIQNAKKGPAIYYGLHFAPGIAEYKDANGSPFRIYISEATAKKMDATYAGKPVYVQHVEEVDLENIQQQADGYVIESFFNQADGMHWAKFIIVSDRGHDAIGKNFYLSNSYQPKSVGPGGTWHGVDYEKEILDGEYDHLALVQNPRYAESVVMTPEEFKAYNEKKQMELAALKNSKDETGGKLMGLLNFFKREKVKNDDFDAMEVVLPKSGVSVSVSKLVNEADEQELKKGKPMNADPSHIVKLHDGSEMTVGELIEKHKNLCDELDEMKKKDEEPKDEIIEEIPGKNEENPEDEDAKKKALELAEHEEKEIEEAKKKDAEKLKNAAEKAERIRNAEINHIEEVREVFLPKDQVERGRVRYGS